MMHIALSYLMELSVLCVKENPVSAEEYRAHQERALSRLRKLLPKPDEGRPQGTGLFKDTDDFLIALKGVLEKSKEEAFSREGAFARTQAASLMSKTD